MTHARHAKTYTTDGPPKPGRSHAEPSDRNEHAPDRQRGMTLPLAGVGLAVLAGAATTALVLSSGPDNRRPVIDPAVIAETAPIQPLGQGQPEDWRRGHETKFYAGDTKPPRLEIDASRIEPGRYSYQGELVIAGDITQPYVTFEAPSITVTGAIKADHVKLTSSPGTIAEQRDPSIFTLAGLDRQEILTGISLYYPRGPVAVGGSVAGEDITITGGPVSVGGDVLGSVRLQGSAGDIAKATVPTDYWDQYTNQPFKWHKVAPEHLQIGPRQPAKTTTPTVSIAGSTGPNVIIDQQGMPAPAQTERKLVTPRMQK